jgi:alpha-ketoglutarate-dependent taurine dioxygenase
MLPRIHPLPGTFGARVSSFDLHRLTSEGRERLSSALGEHLLLIFPRQRLSFDDQVSLTSIFGKVDHRVGPSDRPFRHADDLRIQVVSNDRRRASQTTATVFWHIDQSFRKDPSPVIVLRAVTIPAGGTVTMFADMRAAYDGLSPRDKSLTQTLKARHRFGALLGLKGPSTPSDGVIQPLVRRDPITKRRSLYLNQFCIDSIVGLPRPKGTNLLQKLYTHALQPEFIYAHRWAKGDVVVWHNASLMHRAANISPARRILYRTHTRYRSTWRGDLR